MKYKIHKEPIKGTKFPSSAKITILNTFHYIINSTLRPLKPHNKPQVCPCPKNGEFFHRVKPQTKMHLLEPESSKPQPATS